MTSKSMPQVATGNDLSRFTETSELIDSLATQMRATGDRELPHSFYVEQVKRKLANEKASQSAANDDAVSVKVTGTPPSSVFHSWAIPE